MAKNLAEFVGELKTDELNELISAVNYYGDGDHPRVTPENVHNLANPFYVMHCLGRKYIYTMAGSWNMPCDELDPYLRGYKSMHEGFMDKLNLYFFN